MNPVNYHLVGFAYSGKTTLARELQTKYDFAHISIDEIKWRLGYADVGDDDVPDQVWSAIFEEADRLLLEYLGEGKNVANEYAWVTKEWRNRSKQNASEAGYETIFVHLKVPENEIRKRWLENSTSRKRFHMPENELDRMFGEFEPLDSEEKALIYDGTKTIDEWVEANLPNLANKER